LKFNSTNPYTSRGKVNRLGDLSVSTLKVLTFFNYWYNTQRFAVLFKIYFKNHYVSGMRGHVFFYDLRMFRSNYCLHLLPLNVGSRLLLKLVNFKLTTEGRYYSYTPLREPQISYYSKPGVGNRRHAYQAWHAERFSMAR
jgi:hypothetical protein